MKITTPPQFTKHLSVHVYFIVLATNISPPVLIPDGALPAKEGVRYIPSCVNC